MSGKSTPGYGDMIAHRPRILHLTADYPDAIVRAKTPVIDRLIGLVEDQYAHSVISLNRRSPTLGEAARLLAGRDSPVDEASVQPCHRGICLEYRAPPKGILHLRMLDQVADWIVRRLRSEGERPDLIVGYKLTIEGLIARNVAAQLGIPFALCVQGNTDQKILTFRPDLNAVIASTFHEAACLFSFAPWARGWMEDRLGKREGPTIDLPCPTTHDTIRSPTPGGTALISVFHLRNHKIKNLEGLASAVRAIEAAGEACKVDIVGGGNAEDLAQCAAIAAKTTGITLVGERGADDMAEVMNQAIALVMPSRRESFGLVFVEALFAGLPIIYPKGASIDGYFNGLPFAIGVDARDRLAIADAMRTMIAQEASLKSELAAWQSAGRLQNFTRAEIGKTFGGGLEAALRMQQR